MPAGPRGLTQARGRDIAKPVVGEHLVYGNADNRTRRAVEDARLRAIAMNMLRQAYDENSKAFRVVNADEFPQ